MSAWSRFWRWVDQDFNHTRPWSFGLFAIVLAMPLGLAFALQAPVEVIEWARLFSVGSILFVLLPYYAVRQIGNVIRITKESGSRLRSLSDSKKNR